MNYQQKCHNIFYASPVVNKELSKDCVFEYNYDYYTVNQVRKSDGYVFAYSLSGHAHDLAETHAEDRWEYNYRHFSPEEMADGYHPVIGHPPQLPDWLALIGTTDGEYYYNIYADCICDYNTKEVIVSFNPTTGQPKNEADWEALYELIS